MIKYALEQGLESEFWACFTWALQSPGHVPLGFSLALSFFFFVLYQAMQSEWSFRGEAVRHQYQNTYISQRESH